MYERETVIENSRLNYLTISESDVLERNIKSYILYLQNKFENTIVLGYIKFIYYIELVL